METLTLWVLGLGNQADRFRLEAALKSAPGVSRVRVDLQTNEVDITYDPDQATTQRLENTVQSAGFRLSPYPVPAARGVG